MTTPTNLTWAFFFFQPKSDLAALLQILRCVFAEKSPVYAKPTQPQPPASYRPPQPGYPPQYGGYSLNPPATMPYPVGGPARMPMPVPGMFIRKA